MENHWYISRDGRADIIWAPKLVVALKVHNDKRRSSLASPVMSSGLQHGSGYDTSARDFLAGVLGALAADDRQIACDYALTKSDAWRDVSDARGDAESLLKSLAEILRDDAQINRGSYTKQCVRELSVARCPPDLAFPACATRRATGSCGLRSSVSPSMRSKCATPSSANARDGRLHPRLRGSRSSNPSQALSSTPRVRTSG